MASKVEARRLIDLLPELEEMTAGEKALEPLRKSIAQWTMPHVERVMATLEHGLLEALGDDAGLLALYLILLAGVWRLHYSTVVPMSRQERRELRQDVELDVALAKEAIALNGA